MHGYADTELLFQQRTSLETPLKNDPAELSIICFVFILGR